MPEGATVVFSAHGVSPAVHEQAAERAAQDDRRHLPAGDQGAPRGPAVRRRGLRHPADRPRRPRGGRGHRGRGARRTSSWSRARTTSPRIEVRDPAKVAWLSQTTLSVDETMETVAAHARAVPRAARPAARRHLLRHAEPPAWRSRRSPASADLVIVVGSGNSSNSVRLVEVALEAGAQGGVPRRRRLARSTRRGSTGVDTVGVTSGASVPEDLVEGVLAFLAERGYPDAEAVHTAEESLIFALPPELRRDLKRPADGPARPERAVVRSRGGAARPAAARRTSERTAA